MLLYLHDMLAKLSNSPIYNEFDRCTAVRRLNHLRRTGHVTPYSFGGTPCRVSHTLIHN